VSSSSLTNADPVFATKSGGDMGRGQARPGRPQLEARAESGGGVLEEEQRAASRN